MGDILLDPKLDSKVLTIRTINARINSFLLYLRKLSKKWIAVGTVRLRTDVPNGVNPGKGVHVGRNSITGPQAWDQLLLTLRKQWE